MHQWSNVYKMEKDNKASFVHNINIWNHVINLFQEGLWMSLKWLLNYFTLFSYHEKYGNLKKKNWIKGFLEGGGKVFIFKKEKRLEQENQKTPN